MRKGLGCIVQEELGFGTVGKEKEVEKMRKGLSVIAGIAILLFAYSASAAVVTDDLVSWWGFDETNGTTAYDDPTYGSDNTGTLNGCAWTTDTAGIASSGALYFNGSSDYVEVPDSASLDITNAITIEAWVKSDGKDGTTRRILRKLIPYFIQESEAGNMHFYVSIGMAQKTIHIESADWDTGVWNHIVGTYDKDVSTNNMKIYLNGVLKAQGTETGAIDTDNNPLGIGTLIGSGANYFKGTMDELRIYNKALTQGEIQQNYDAIPEPSTLLFVGAGLLGLLAFRRIKR